MTVRARRVVPPLGVFVLAAFLATVASAQVPQHLYYKFNEGSGTTTANSGVPGQGSNPVTFPANPPDWITPGKLGPSCVSFLSRTALTTGWTASTTTTDSWTIEAWIRRTSATVTQSGYLCGTGTSSFRVFLSNSRINVFSFGSASIIQTPSPTWVDGNWHHMAIVYNAQGPDVRIYLDGVVDITMTSYTGAIGSGPFTVGSNSAGGTTFPGEVDDFRFWNVARTQAEILAAMNSELPLGPTLTVGATTGTRQMVLADEQGPGGNGLAVGTFSIDANNQPPGVTMTGIELAASGSGNDATAFSEVRIYRDHPTLGTQGVFDPSDEFATNADVFTTDNGVINFNVVVSEQGFNPQDSRDYFVVVKLDSQALPGDIFDFTINDITVDSSSFRTVPPNSTMEGIEIDTPSFVFTDFSPTPAPEAFVTQPAVCNVFTIGYPAGPDDKPASITINSQGSADEAADLDDVDLYWDFDNDGAFLAANDTLINTQVFTNDNGDLVFDLASLPDFTAGDTRRFFVVYNLNANADDMQTFQCRVFSMGNAPLGGVASGLPLPFSAGLEVRAAILFVSMDGPTAAATVDSDAQEVVIADVLLHSLPGGVGDWNIPTLTFNAGGTGNHNQAYSSLSLYEDTNTNNTWDAGDTLAAPVLPGFTANVADFDLIQPNMPTNANRRFFLVGDLSGLAATGDTFGARLSNLTVTQRPNGGQELGFPTPASTALIINVPALSVSNAPEQPAPATHAAGAAGELVAAAFRLNALNGGCTVNGITFATSGTGDWSSDVNATTGVAVYHDNGDGVYSATDDALLDETGGASPVVATSFNLTLATGEIADLWVVIRLTPTAGQGVAATPETFIVSINDPSTDVSATIPATTGMPAPNGVAVGAIEFNVTNFDPANALQAGTQPITITGSGFMAPFSVIIGGTVCPGTPVIAGGTQVTGLTVPPGVGANLPIIIQSGTLLPQTLTQTFTYTSPKDNDPPKSDDGSSCASSQSKQWMALMAALSLLTAITALRRRTA